MSNFEPCGPHCLLPRDPSTTRPLSSSSRPEISLVVGDSVIRSISAGSEDPNHPFSLAGETPTLDGRRALLSRIQQERPEHVLTVAGLCDCSVRSPYLEGRPLQDFGLGPDGNRLVAPANRRIHRQPAELERLLAELVAGLQALHRIGVAHGDPALMNAFVAAGNPGEAVWVDLNSVRPATPEAVAVDIAGFVLTCMWPALLDAAHHSPSLFNELVGIQCSDSFDLEQLQAALRTAPTDHRAGNGRSALLAALKSRSAHPGNAQAIRAMASFLGPAYLLDQTRTDQTARFLQVVLAAERTRNTLVEEERTRLLNLKFEGELARSRAAIDELRSWAAELQEAVRHHHDRANASEVLGARLVHERDVAQSEVHRLTVELGARDAELAAIKGSKAWRIFRVIWAIRRVAGRLLAAGAGPDKPADAAVPASPEAPDPSPAAEPTADLTGLLPDQFPPGTGRPVLVSLPWFVTGGADRFVEYLLEHWRDSGRTVVVITTTPLGENMQSRFDELLQLTPFAYDLTAMGPAESWYPFVDAALGRLGEASIFNVGSRWMYDSMGGLLEAHPAIRVVDQQFNDIGHLDSNRREQGHLALTVAAHQALAEIICSDGRSPDKVVTAYVGIPEPERATEQQLADLRSELGIHVPRVVLFIGRLSEEKRPEWVLALAADLAGDDVAIVMVGSGPQEADLRGGIEALPNLIWRSYLDNIGAAIGLADVLVLPSQTEGIPLTVMEAISLGVPVVATRVGGLGELEDIPGFRLCEPDDFPGFVAAVRETLDSPVPAGIALPDRFGVDHMVRSYDDFIDRTLPAGTTAGSVGSLA